MNIEKLRKKMGCSVQILSEGVDMQYFDVYNMLTGIKPMSKGFIKKAYIFLLINYTKRVI